MIRIHISEKTNQEIVITIDGHSGAAAIGQDIVCSAASILIYTWAQTVHEIYESGQLQDIPKISLKSGSSRVSCTADNLYHEEVKQKFAVIKTGYNLLANHYPQYVKVEIASPTPRAD